MSFGTRLREERERLGLSQAEMGELVGASKRTVIDWEKDSTSPTGHALEQLGMKGLDVAYVVTGRRASAPGFVQESAPAYGFARARHLASHGDELHTVPRYSLRVSAGNGDRAHPREEELRGVFAFSADWMRRNLGRASGGFASVTVCGDSMEPSLRDGDEVVVDLVASTPPLADGVYIIALGDELRVKRLRMRMDGSVEVRGDNPVYAAELLPPSAASDLRVIGRVVWPRIR